MDNNQQPTQPVDQPSANANGVSSTPPENNNDNYAPTPTSTGQNDVMLQSDSGKKKGKGPIIAIIAIIVALLAGGGGLFAAYAISNQPENILASAASNFLKATNTGVATDTTMTLDMDEESTGIDRIEMTGQGQAINSNMMSDGNIKIVLADSQEVNLQYGEYINSEGEIYFKLDGLKQIYTEDLRKQVSSAVKEQLKTELPMTNMTEEAHINGLTMQITNKISSIVNMVDGNWIKISVDEILQSDLVSSMGIDATTRQIIVSAYKCAFEKLTNISQYSDDLLNYYNQNPFVTMTAGQDSFYTISFDDAKLAGFINTFPKMQLINDVAQCVSYTIPSDAALNVSASDVSELTRSLNNVYQVKFDGFFDHHLSEIKAEVASPELGTLSMDAKYSYPTNITISAPTDSTPVMDIVEEIMTLIGDMPIDESIIDVYEQEVTDML